MKQDQHEEPIVVHAEALYGGDVLITFADAHCAVYTTPLLRSILSLTDRFIDHEFKKKQQEREGPRPPRPPTDETN
jgi:hypothetical protein